MMRCWLIKPLSLQDMSVSSSLIFKVSMAVSFFIWSSAFAQVVTQTDNESWRLLAPNDKLIFESSSPITEVALIRIPDSNIIALTWHVQPSNALETDSYGYSLQVDDGDWKRAKTTDYVIKLKNHEFDPLRDTKLPRDVPPELRARPGSELYLVQFKTQPLEAYRAQIRQLNGEVYTYLPELTHLARLSDKALASVRGLPFVRWVGPMHPFFKLDELVLTLLSSPAAIDSRTRYLLLAVSKEDKLTILQLLEQLKSPINERLDGTDLVAAELTRRDLLELAAHDSVAWIELATSPQIDTNNARYQGGATFMESLMPSYTGIGIRGHSLEGIHQAHPDFRANANRSAPIAAGDNTSHFHGTWVFGVLFSDGSGADPHARGIIPNAQGFYTHYRFIYSAPPGSTAPGSRHKLVEDLISEHQVMFQTASWGYPETTKYADRSKEMDDLIFDHDIPITQSQGNEGTLQSRPQAWAKNIISVGAVEHCNTSDPADDKWNVEASTGPAEMGRVKPDLCAYFDQINTTAGSAGYTSSFGQTSGATAIVAGYLGVVIEMWTNQAFGNSLPMAPTPANRFMNRPHATTAKALLICSARPYEFPPKTNIDRYRQGWGFPDVQTLHNLREKSFIVNESDLLGELASNVYKIPVAASEPMLRITMVYSEPGGFPASSGTMLRNNLDLKVTAPDGRIFWGNHGLLTGNQSIDGGNPNEFDNVENVFIHEPEVGDWTVEVIADSLTVDTNPENAEFDAAYALVVLGTSE